MSIPKLTLQVLMIGTIADVSRDTNAVLLYLLTLNGKYHLAAIESWKESTLKVRKYYEFNYCNSEIS